jgi:hypothetical protein
MVAPRRGLKRRTSPERCDARSSPGRRP